MRELVCDPFYMLTEPRLAASAMICWSSSVLAAGVVLEYQEHNHSAYFIAQFYDIKYNLIKFPLNYSNKNNLFA